MAVTHPDPEYSRIVRRLVYRARREYPLLADRLARAEAIVLQDDQPVVLYEDGTATVRSACDPTRTYRVEGTRCTCPDHQQRRHICKHALSARLVRRALREARDEATRRRSYGAQYVAPGTPHAVVACDQCGIVAQLDGAGRCPECWVDRVIGVRVAHAAEVA